MTVTNMVLVDAAAGAEVDVLRDPEMDVFSSVSRAATRTPESRRWLRKYIVCSVIPWWWIDWGCREGNGKRSAKMSELI